MNENGRFLSVRGVDTFPRWLTFWILVCAMVDDVTNYIQPSFYSGRFARHRSNNPELLRIGDDGDRGVTDIDTYPSILNTAAAYFTHNKFLYLEDVKILNQSLRLLPSWNSSSDIDFEMLRPEKQLLLAQIVLLVPLFATLSNSSEYTINSTSWERLVTGSNAPLIYLRYKAGPRLLSHYLVSLRF